MKIVLAADPFAYGLKKALAAHLSKQMHEIVDADNYKGVAYYDAAATASGMIQNGHANCGILLCGTGAGMSIVANKFSGICAVAVESVFTAARARAINNANVITMGAMVVGEAMACEMADVWLKTKFTQGLEELAGFLNDAVKAVDAIDAQNRKMEHETK